MPSPAGRERSSNIVGNGAILDALDAEGLLGAEEFALKLAAAMVTAEGKRVLGTYEYKWPQLQADTQAERVRLGFSPNEPLLRSGAMRDSISFVVTVPGKEAWVGSNLKAAAALVWLLVVAGQSSRGAWGRQRDTPSRRCEGGGITIAAGAGRTRPIAKAC